MKTHFELFSIFKGFSTQIQNQLGKTTKVLGSDYAREYLSAHFQSYFTT